MPVINIDEQVAVWGPIEVLLDGKTYTVDKLTEEMLDKVSDLDGMDPKDLPISTVREHLAGLFGVEPADLAGTDFRKTALAFKLIMETIGKQMGADKDPKGGGGGKK